MALLTIFTPTFNRRRVLPRLYESLNSQSNKDFVWQIVDDGSTDGTRELVSAWIADGEVQIDYIQQENHGKPFATNVSLGKCNTKLWTCVDSDDYVSQDAVETILRECGKAAENPLCCGIVSPKLDCKSHLPLGSHGKQNRWNCLSNGEFLNNTELVYKFKLFADKAYVFFAQIIKQYQYPILEGEKFIGESILYERMAQKYLYYISLSPFYLCEYLSDGLTKNNWRLHIKNPQGYKLLKCEAMLFPKPYIYRLKNAISYVVACFLCHDNKIIVQSPAPFLTLLAYLPAVALYRKRYLPEIAKTNMQ